MNDFHEQAFRAAIDAKLASLVADPETPPDWYQTWKALAPTADAERLTIFQQLRDEAVLPEEAGFFLVAWQIDGIASRLADLELRTLEDRMIEIEEAHGLRDGEFWSEGEGPPEYETLREEYQEAWDELLAVQLEAHGEYEMAALVRENYAEYQRLFEAGRQYFEPLASAAAAPEWLGQLVEKIGELMHAESVHGPLGFRFLKEQERWEVLVYPLPVELLGGAVDGEVVAPGFTLDLIKLPTLFDSIIEVVWSTLGVYDSESPSVSIDGVYAGQRALIRILSEAPADEEPGAKVDPRRKDKE